MSLSGLGEVRVGTSHTRLRPSPSLDLSHGELKILITRMSSSHQIKYIEYNLIDIETQKITRSERSCKSAFKCNVFVI